MDNDKRAEMFMLTNRMRSMPPGFAKEEMLRKLKKLQEELRDD